MRLSTKTLLLTFGIVISATILVGSVSSITNAAPATVVKDANEPMASYTKKWLYYRAVVGCYSVHDVRGTSKDNVEAFKWFETNLGHDVRTSMGYVGGSDGVESCGDDSFLRTAHTEINPATDADHPEWSSGIYAFCAVQGAAKSNNGSDEMGCRDGSDDFDMEGSKDDQVNDFKTAKGNHAPESENFPYDPKPSGEMWYYLYRRTLEYFCGGDKRMYDPTAQASASTETDAVRKVSYVDGTTGEVIAIYYKLGGGKDKNSSIEKIYSTTGMSTFGYDGGDVKGANFVSHSCEEIANKTEDHAPGYSTWVYTYLNKAAADALIEQIDMDKASAYVKRQCGDADTTLSHICASTQRNKIVTAIETCSEQPSLRKGEAGLDFDKRFDIIKACALEEIPSGLRPALDASIQPGEDPGGGPGASGTTCAVEGIGWMVCPVITAMSKAADTAFELLAKGFLETDASLVATGGGTYQAWTKMRDLANVAFVVAFMIIIYSQMTGAGLSNYGVKKMLPKIIVAAILVNVSYFICQVIVDVTNILGYGIYDMLTGIANTISLNGGGAGGTATGADLGAGLGLAQIAVAVLATVAIIWLMLPLLGGIILMALITLVTIVIILLLRKALIVLLIFISPLAFVAYLLPNTEQYFNKWKDMFIKLLLVFPIVALLFGAGNLAGKVILAAGSGASDYGSYSQGESSEWTLGLVAAGVTVAPLLAVWAVLQGAISAAGAIGGKISSFNNKAGQGLGGKVGKAIKAGRLGEAKTAFDTRRTGRRIARRTGSGYLATRGRKLGEDSKLGRALVKAGTLSQRFDQTAAGKYAGGDRGAAAAAAAGSKIENEAVDNAALVMQKQPGWTAATTIPKAQEELATAIRNGDTTRARAAQKILIGAKSKGVEALGKTLDSNINASNMNTDTAQFLKSDITSAGLKGTDAAIDTWSRDNSGATINNVASKAGSLDGLTDAELAGQSAVRIRQAGISQTRAEGIMDNQQVWGNLSEEKKNILSENAAGVRNESQDQAHDAANRQQPPGGP